MPSKAATLKTKVHKEDAIVSAAPARFEPLIRIDGLITRMTNEVVLWMDERGGFPKRDAEIVIVPSTPAEFEQGTWASLILVERGKNVRAFEFTEALSVFPLRKFPEPRACLVFGSQWPSANGET